MIVRARVASWQVESSGRVMAVGDRVSSWLTFQEADGGAQSVEEVHVIRGVATPLPSWPGVSYGRHPVRIDLDPGALYWDAPEPVEGAIEIAGRVSWNDLDAPDGFPESHGEVRRVRMEWHDVVMGPDGVWTPRAGAPRYEEVSASYFPPSENVPLDPAVEAALRRRARAAYRREVPLWRRLRGEHFSVTLATHSDGDAPEIPVGTTETQWTGVLLELELTGRA